MSDAEISDFGAYESEFVQNLHDQPEINLLTDVDVSPDDVKFMLRHDPEFFINFFLPELLFDVPAFHKELFRSCTSLTDPRVVLAVPRGHAKTTISKLVCIWYLLFTNIRFICYVSNSAPIAKNAIRDIIGFLRTENFEAVYGRVHLEKESETEGYWIFKIGTKKCILRAAGAGQQFRGLNVDNQRPELVVVDDLEDDKNTNTKELQESVIRWFYKTLLKALSNTSHKVIFLGNMVRKGCLLERLCTSPVWQAFRYGAIVRDRTSGKFVSLWPEMFPLKELLEDYKEHARQSIADIWLCEMMNMPGMGLRGYDAASIYYDRMPLKSQILATFITIDPAFSTKNSADNSAVVVHALRHNACPMSIRYEVGKVKEKDLWRIVMRLALYYHARIIGIESVAAQRSLIVLFELLSANAGMFGFQFVPIVAGQESKTERISTFVALMGNKAWAIPEGDLHITTQLLAYDKSSRNNDDDDLIDAVSMGPKMTEDYFPMILASSLPFDPEAAQPQKLSEMTRV